MKKQSHWDKHAAQWQLLESPLRPNRQDVAYYEWAARQAHDSSGGERSKALLLGVTPEIASMHWPPETRLLAVDCCKEMVRDVWPLHGRHDALAVCGDWFSLPAFSGKMEFVVGDGCFTLVDYPKGYLKLASSIHAALSKGGRVVLRFFVRPEVREDIKDIALDLENERIGSFHAFKWRLAMALHSDDLAEGVILADVWQCWHDLFSEKNEVFRRLGWSEQVLATINNYQGVRTRYTFPTLEEIRLLFNQLFEEEDCHFAEYELADRCPIMIFSAK